MMTLVQADWAYHPVRPVAPVARFVGPLLPQPPRPITQQPMADFLDGAPARSLALVSAGSGLRFPNTALVAMLAALLQQDAWQQLRVVVKAADSQVQVTTCAWNMLYMVRTWFVIIALCRLP